jgi:hypothetical protein
MNSMCYKLGFGKYKGLSLLDIFEENPGYLDWLVSQDWLHKPTRKAIINFVSKPMVETQLATLFSGESHNEGPEKRKPRNGAIGTILSAPVVSHVVYEAIRFDSFRGRWVGVNPVQMQKEAIQVSIWDNEPTYKVFVVQEQVSKYFNHGKRSFIQPDRPASEQLDLDKRPDNWITMNTRWDHTKKAMARRGYWTEVELEIATQPEEPTVLKPGSAWRLTADLAIQLEEARSREEVPAARHPAAGLLKTFQLNIAGRKSIQGKLKPMRERFEALPKTCTQPERPIDHDAFQDRLQELLSTIPLQHRKDRKRVRQQMMDAFDPCI